MCGNFVPRIISSMISTSQRSTCTTRNDIQMIQSKHALIVYNQSQPPSHTCRRSGAWKPFSEATEALRLKRESSVTITDIFSTRTNDSDMGLAATPSGGRSSPMANDRHIAWRNPADTTAALERLATVTQTP